MLTAPDFRGLYAIIPTPARPGAERIDAVDTVDLHATERLVEKLIDDGVDGIIALGTTGECATLSESDYRTFAGHVLRCVDGRAQTVMGASALGGHQVASRLRFLQEHGADATLLGLPMWQPVTTEMAINFFRSISEAFPELAVMVYANQRAFRFNFPLDFWRAVAGVAPTVVAAKYSRPKDLVGLLEATEGRINIVPNESTVMTFADAAPESTVAMWATAAAMGPAPTRALIDAITTGDLQRARHIGTEIDNANEPVAHLFGDPEIFAAYNIQLEKARINAAAYCECGPFRPPYTYLPEEYAQSAADCGERWRALHNRYVTDQAADPR